MHILRQSTNVDVLIGPFVDATDGVTAETALTIEDSDIQLSANGQTMADKNDVTSAAHDANGFYNCELDTTDTATVGNLVLSVTVAGALPVRHEYQIVEENVYDALFAGSAALGTDVASILTDTGTTLQGELDGIQADTEDIQSRLPAALVSGRIDASVGAVAANAITATAIASNAITAAKIATDAITAAKIATDAITAAKIAANAIGASELAADAVAEIADAIWDEDATGHQTGGTFGQAIGDPGANTETMYDAVVTDAAGTNVAADVIAVKADTAATLTDTADMQPKLGSPAGADISADIAAVKSDTAATLTDTAEIGAAGAGLTEAGGTGDHLTAVPWNSAWDTEVQSEVQDAIEANHLDHLLAADYDPASKPGTSTALLNELIESDGGVSRFTVNALEQGPGGSGTNPFVIASGTIGATGNDTTHLHLTGLGYGDDELNDLLIVVYDDSASLYYSTWITDWANSGDLATVDTLPFTPEDSTDTYTVLGVRQDVTGGSGLDAAGVRDAVGLASANLDTQLGDIDTDTTAIVADTNELQGDWANGGRLDLIVDAILVDTAEIGAAGVGLAEAGGDGDHLTAIAWNAAWDAQVESEVTDALNAYDPPTKTELDSGLAALNDPTAEAVADAVWDESQWDHQAVNSFGAVLSTSRISTAQAGAATTITLDTSAYASDDAYNGLGIKIVAGTGSGQWNVITDYTGATKVATVLRTWITNPSSDSIYVITDPVLLASEILDSIVDDSTQIDASVLNTAAAAIGSDGTGLTEAGGDGDHLTEAGGTGDQLTALATASNLATAQADLDIITGADGANLLSATQASIDAIEADTNELQGDDVPALIATAQADLDIITGASGVNLLTATQASIDAIEADTNELQGDDVPALIAALNDLSAAAVNAEVVDALATDTYAEPTGVPASTDDLATKIGYIYMALRNQVTVTATKKIFYDDSGTAEWEKDLSDDATTYTETKGNAP